MNNLSFIDIFKKGFPGAAAAAKSLQSYPTLCDPRDGSPPGSPVPGTLIGVQMLIMSVKVMLMVEWRRGGQGFPR